MDFRALVFVAIFLILTMAKVNPATVSKAYLIIDYAALCAVPWGEHSPESRGAFKGGSSPNLPDASEIGISAIHQ